MTRRRSAALAAALALVFALAGCDVAGLGLGLGPDTLDGRVPEGTLAAAAATAALGTLIVAPGGELAGYDRDCSPGQGCVFGPAWSDDVGVAGGHNGCDTRNDVLNRDLYAGQLDGVAVPKTYKPPGQCVLLEGLLDDPYTGTTRHFTKQKAGDLQIDHVVPLAAAWRAGANTWPPQRRQDFANDPHNLLTVDGRTNESKGDSTAEEWLPPSAGYQCEYARIVVTVKSGYGLTVTAAEQAALRSALGKCPPPATAPVAPTT